jgi:hypothetical protein
MLYNFHVQHDDSKHYLAEQRRLNIQKSSLVCLFLHTVIFTFSEELTYLLLSCICFMQISKIIRGVLQVWTVSAGSNRKRNHVCGPGRMRPGGSLRRGGHVLQPQTRLPVRALSAGLHRYQHGRDSVKEHPIRRNGFKFFHSPINVQNNT